MHMLLGEALFPLQGSYPTLSLEVNSNGKVSVWDLVCSLLRGFVCYIQSIFYRRF